MFKIYGHYIYLTKQQEDKIFNEVTKSEDIWWIAASKMIGNLENIEKNKRMERYIKENFRDEYYKFNFCGKDARKNVTDILFSYASLTDIIKIFRADDISYNDAFEESITGSYNIKRIKIKIYEKIFFGLFGIKDTGNSITISIDKVERVYGELQNFILESETFNVRFTKDNVNIIYI